MSEALCYLALGANLGDRVEALREATRRIGALPETIVVARSAIYETPPWGKTDQAAFLNAAITVRTALKPEALLDACLGIEIAMGRVRRERWGPRLIDIDLLTHGKTRMKSERLTLPHPAMAQRAFVLVPLLEIAPDFRIGREKAKTVLTRLDRTGIVPVGQL
ncbi:MAG: 2-amino-4-hydroxy-6-hydroxymethyldihydropteridine diphosphokinase [Rhabdaerophilum sp.]